MATIERTSEFWKAYRMGVLPADFVDEGFITPEELLRQRWQYHPIHRLYTDNESVKFRVRNRVNATAVFKEQVVTDDEIVQAVRLLANTVQYRMMSNFATERPSIALNEFVPQAKKID